MSSKLLIVLMTIIAFAVGASFYSSASNQQRSAALLEEKISNATQNLKTITDKNRFLEAEISGISSEISDARGKLVLSKQSSLMPEMVNSNTIVRTVIEYGNKAGVKVIPLSTEDWKPVTIEKQDYHVFKMSVEVVGLKQNVIDFIRQVQDTINPYLVIESLDVYFSTNEGESGLSDSNTTSADLKFAIYAR
jgi:hypothetical protein